MAQQTFTSVELQNKFNEIGEQLGSISNFNVTFNDGFISVNYTSNGEEKWFGVSDVSGGFIVTSLLFVKDLLQQDI